MSCSSCLSLARRPPLLQVADLKLRKTIVMQCYWRGYRARCRAHDMRERLEERKRRIWEEEAQARVEAEERHKKEVERRMHPRKFEDFEILYNELEAWRAHETRRIKDANMDDAERMAALSQLLHKETKLLQAIDRFKLTANGENRDLRIKKMLELMADPKKWEVSILRIRTCGRPSHTLLLKPFSIYTTSVLNDPRMLYVMRCVWYYTWHVHVETWRNNHTSYSYLSFVPFIRTVYTDGGRGDGGGAHAVHDAR